MGSVFEDEQDAEQKKRIIEAADLDGRPPKDGEMYRGLGLYLCRNMIENHRPGRDYDITLSDDGMFENISPTEPDPSHENHLFPLLVDQCRTRYRGIGSALEALALLMEEHGNHRHAREFRMEIENLNVGD